MKPLLIGDVASRAGESAHTIRYYEALGLLVKPKRTAAGYRIYSSKIIGRIHFIRKAQSLGLSLREIRHIFQLKDSGRSPNTFLDRILTKRLRELHTRVQTIRLLESRIRYVLKQSGQPGQRHRKTGVYGRLARQPLPGNRIRRET